jgi:hypothetical protein
MGENWLAAQLWAQDGSNVRYIQVRGHLQMLRHQRYTEQEKVESPVHAFLAKVNQGLFVSALVL